MPIQDTVDGQAEMLAFDPPVIWSIASGTAGVNIVVLPAEAGRLSNRLLLPWVGCVPILKLLSLVLKRCF